MNKTISLFSFSTTFSFFSAETLCGNPRWCKLVEYARDNDALLTLTEAYQPIMPLLQSSFSSSVSANHTGIVSDENTKNSEFSDFNCSRELNVSHLKSKKVGGGGVKRSRDEDGADDLHGTDSSNLKTQNFTI